MSVQTPTTTPTFHHERLAVEPILPPHEDKENILPPPAAASKMPVSIGRGMNLMQAGLFSLNQGKFGDQFSRGCSFIHSKKYPEAIEELEGILKKHPQSELALRMCIESYAQLLKSHQGNHLDKTVMYTHLNALLKLDSEDATALGTRGYILYKWGWDELALKDLDKAIELGSLLSAHAYAAKGDILFKQGSNQKADLNLEKAFGLDSHCILAYFVRAKQAFSKGAYEECLKHLNHLKELGTRDPAALCLETRVLLQKEDYETAQAVFLEARQIGPSHAAVKTLRREIRELLVR